MDESSEWDGSNEWGGRHMTQCNMYVIPRWGPHRLCLMACILFLTHMHAGTDLTHIVCVLLPLTDLVQEPTMEERLPDSGGRAKRH